MKIIKFITTVSLTALICSCNFESFDERCTREAKEYTEKYCPRRMNEYTMMDSLVFDSETHTFSYYYCLEGKLDNDTVINKEVANAFVEQLKKELTTSVELRSYKEKEVNFHYIYLSQKTGKVLFEKTFSPSDYNPTGKK